MKKLSAAITVACIFFASTASADAIVKQPTIGCQSSNDYDKYISLIGAHDKPAAEKFLGPLFITGQCKVFAPGDEVSITETALTSFRVSIRPKGEVESYWTSMQRIETR